MPSLILGFFFFLKNVLFTFFLVSTDNMSMVISKSTVNFFQYDIIILYFYGNYYVYNKRTLLILVFKSPYPFYYLPLYNLFLFPTKGFTRSQSVIILFTEIPLKSFQPEFLFQHEQGNPLLCSTALPSSFDSHF